MSRPFWLLALLTPSHVAAWRILFGMPFLWLITGAFAAGWFPKVPPPGQTPFWWQPFAYSDRNGLPNPAHPWGLCLLLLWAVMLLVWLAAYAVLAAPGFARVFGNHAA